MIHGPRFEARTHEIRDDEDLVRAAADSVVAEVAEAEEAAVVLAAAGVAAVGVATDLARRKWPRCGRRCSRR